MRTNQQLADAFEEKLNAVQGLRSLISELASVEGIKLFTDYCILPLVDGACIFITGFLVTVIKHLHK